MWKEEKPIQPFNATAHVSIDNLNFVTGLRKSASLDTRIKEYREQKMSAEAETLEKKFSKPTNCIFQSCMSVGSDIAETLNEVRYCSLCNNLELLNHIFLFDGLQMFKETCF